MTAARFLKFSFLLAMAFPASILFAGANRDTGGLQSATILRAGPDNPRNSEGSFIQLNDGKLLFAYSRFYGEKGSDFARAAIVYRSSLDAGRTWSASDIPLVATDGFLNVMSVSFLRLQDGRIALFYVGKKSVSDAKVYVRYSSDEAHTWSKPTPCMQGPGYYVLNNDRVIQTRTGRILVPVAMQSKRRRFTEHGVVMVYLSDDDGKTWRRSKETLSNPTTNRDGFQEPGAVELKNGQIMMFMRTSMGSQYLSWSRDEGDHWTQPVASSIKSPLSPASIKRIPSTGDLLLVWNDHSDVPLAYLASGHSFGRRTPLTVAISKDDGKTWIHIQNLLTDPNGCYCYTAIAFVRNRVLLGFSTTEDHLPCLSDLELLGLPIRSLYRN